MTRHIAVIGTGVIGTGWAARLIAQGHVVKAWDPAPGFAETLKSEIDRLWPTLEKFGVSADASPSNLVTTNTLAEACEGAYLIQECTPENLEIKREVHRAIDESSDVAAIIASSSSGLLPTDIQSVCSHPERFLIAHPFNPVYLLPLVELVPGKDTSQATMEAARDHFSAIGMHPLIVKKEIEGYLSDRLQEALWREALHLVNDGVASTKDLDDAIIYGPGLRWAFMGTCLTFHLAGGKGGMRHMLEQFGPALKLPWTHLEAPELTETLINQMVEGTAEQAGGRTIEEMEKLRDDCLIEIMEALSKFEIGAGEIRNRSQVRQ